MIHKFIEWVLNTLRPYQNEIITRLNSQWEEGTRRVMIQMPTGTGKTEVFAAIVKSTSKVMMIRCLSWFIVKNS